MNKTELVKKVAHENGKRTNEVEKILDAVTSAIIDEVARGGKVSIANFGTFETTERAGRTFRNPQTGGTVERPASRSPKFKPAKAFKGFVKALYK